MNSRTTKEDAEHNHVNRDLLKDEKQILTLTLNVSDQAENGG